MSDDIVAFQGAHSRKKRFDPGDFESAVTEDVVQTDCASGQIQNSDETCTTCTAGTYANTANAQVCTACALDTYSAEGATECIACASGLGTLDNGSDEIADCIGMLNFQNFFGVLSSFTLFTKNCSPSQ